MRILASSIDDVFKVNSIVLGNVCIFKQKKQDANNSIVCMKGRRDQPFHCYRQIVFGEKIVQLWQKISNRSFWFLEISMYTKGNFPRFSFALSFFLIMRSMTSAEEVVSYAGHSVSGHSSWWYPTQWAGPQNWASSISQSPMLGLAEVLHDHNKCYTLKVSSCQHTFNII